MMGINADKPRGRGALYLVTRDSSPFCGKTSWIWSYQAIVSYIIKYHPPLYKISSESCTIGINAERFTSMWFTNTICREVVNDNSFISIGHLPKPTFYEFIGAADTSFKHLYAKKTVLKMNNIL
jgi:hypothetical protein